MKMSGVWRVGVTRVRGLSCPVLVASIKNVVSFISNQGARCERSTRLRAQDGRFPADRETGTRERQIAKSSCRRAFSPPPSNERSMRAPFGRQQIHHIRHLHESWRCSWRSIRGSGSTAPQQS